MTLQKRKERVALLSIISNSFLVVTKLTVGLLIGSVSIISEAIHSGMDLLASFIALFSVRTSHLPADVRHPFGHGKAESISGLVEALLIFVAAFWIILEAIKKFLSPEEMKFVGWGIGVMFLSFVLNLIVSRLLFKVSKETESLALEADAWHLRTDVYTSAGVMFSLSIIWVGRSFFPGLNFHWLDPAGALIVAIIIMRAAYDLTLRSIRDLMDVQLSRDDEQWIREIIIQYQPIVHGFHQLRTRRAGNFRFIEFHVKVDPQMSVSSSHDVTKSLKHIILSRFPESSVIIHIEPCDGECEEKCAAGCFLTLEERKRQKYLFP